MQVVNQENSKTNKPKIQFARSSVFDKIKTEFGQKLQDRYLFALVFNMFTDMEKPIKFLVDIWSVVLGYLVPLKILLSRKCLFSRNFKGNFKV